MTEPKLIRLEEKVGIKHHLKPGCWLNRLALGGKGGTVVCVLRQAKTQR